MMNNKVMMAGLVGSVAFFLLGWLVYGMLLMDFMAANAGTATGVNKSQEEMSFLWIIISNLASGYLLAIVLGWANANTAMSGARAGGILGLLMAISYDGVMYGTTNIMNMTGMWVDVIVWTIMCAVVGAITGAMLGRSIKTATA